MSDFTLLGSPVTVLSQGTGPVILCLTDRGEGEEMVPHLTGTDAEIWAWQVRDWSADLSPWPAEGVRKEEQFPGQGDVLLQAMTETLPERFPGRPLGIAGYSLAGMFALYALMSSDIFRGAASCSGSLWYPGFSEWATNRKVSRSCVYLSLGDREPLTRHHVMRTVGEKTELFYQQCQNTPKCRTFFEWNPGGHFQNPGERLARGVCWLGKAMTETEENA